MTESLEHKSPCLSHLIIRSYVTITGSDFTYKQQIKNKKKIVPKQTTRSHTYKNVWLRCCMLVTQQQFLCRLFWQRVQRRKYTVWIPATSEVTQILLHGGSWTKSCKFLIPSIRSIYPFMFKILHLINLTVLDDLCKLCRFILWPFYMLTLPSPTTSSVSHFVQALISV
jgi:hypothetical protein